MRRSQRPWRYLKQYGERFREIRGGRARFAPWNRASRMTRRRSSFSIRSTIRRLPLTWPKDGPSSPWAAGEPRSAAVAQPSLPINARWTKADVFSDEFRIGQIVDADGHRRPNTAGLQTGRVWQAEEVREGDRWRRYYGFVGRQALTRVPAEEIEFPTPWGQGWSLLSTDLDARIVVKDAATPARSPSSSSSETIAGSSRPPRPTLCVTPTACPRSARGSPSGSSACRTSPSRPTRSQGGKAPPRRSPFPPRKSPPGRSTGTRRERRPEGLAPAGDTLAFRLDLSQSSPSISRAAIAWSSVSTT